ncbi:DnaJ homolog subfamily B member 12 [Galdieria sulphuraria]|nr:DnaJ homolog subfamily B member 12 [Galdieria sulphuraria]
MELSENYQQAKRCLERSRQYILEHNEGAAKKFLEKAKRLCPGLKEIKQVEKELSEVLATKVSTGENKKRTGKEHQETFNGVDNERRREATEEQTTLVEHIKRQNNYYKILNIKQDASMEDIKRSFRKLAVKLHPDKNPCPGAEEAFKKVAKAFQALSDPVRRAEYDRSGVDTGEQRAIPRRRTSSRQGASSAFFFDPFTGTFRERPFTGFHQTPFFTSEDFLFQFFRNFHASNASEQEYSFGSHIIDAFKYVASVIDCITRIFFSVPSSPLFQLYPDSTYSIERRTAHAGVLYYVKPSLQWDSLKPNEVLKLEQEVEHSKLMELSGKCAMERQHYLERNLPLFHTENHRRKLLQDFNSTNCEHFENLRPLLVRYG